MTGAKMIGCINHPGVEAMGRCRQCSKPVCKQCGFVTSTGMYCSEACQDKHQDFMKRAVDVDVDLNKRQRRSLRQKFGGLVTFLVIVAVVILGLGLLSIFVHIPYLSYWTITVRTFLGLM